MAADIDPLLSTFVNRGSTPVSPWRRRTILTRNAFFADALCSSGNEASNGRRQQWAPSPNLEMILWTSALPSWSPRITCAFVVETTVIPAIQGQNQLSKPLLFHQRILVLDLVDFCFKILKSSFLHNLGFCF
jgi:hypothetical protein